MNPDIIIEVMFFIGLCGFCAVLFSHQRRLRHLEAEVMKLNPDITLPR
jgi:hypothetical protein